MFRSNSKFHVNMWFVWSWGPIQYNIIRDQLMGSFVRKCWQCTERKSHLKRELCETDVQKLKSVTRISTENK